MNKITNIHSQLVDKEIELQNMKKFLEERRIRSQHAQVMEQIGSEGSLEITAEDKSVVLGEISQANRDYIEAIQNRLPFINRELSDFICLGGKTLYLVCGGTGQGKSTTVGAIIGPVIDRTKKVLVITNEEAREDVYNRVACARLGKSFQLFKKGMLHPMENDTISHEAENLQHILKVVDTNFKNNPDFVTTPQGIAAVCEAFKDDVDLIVLDYYQNINHSIPSTGDLRPEPHHHQLKFCHWVNGFKNRYGKPFVVISQIRKPNKSDSTTFEERLMGSKYIGTVSLIHIELRPDFQNYTTDFICHKDRFWGKTGKAFRQGFDWTTNSFVPFDDSFQAKVAQWNLNQAQSTAQESDNEKPLEELTGGDTSETAVQQGADLLVLDDLV